MDIANTASTGGYLKTSPESSFNQTILRFLEKIEYRPVTGGEDLEQIYRLRYDSYLQAGMVAENTRRMLDDRWDGLPNSHCFGVFLTGQLIGTVRMHLISKEHPYGPSLDVFPDAISRRIENGERFLDVTRFGGDASKVPLARALPYVTLRLVMVASSHFDYPVGLAPIRPEHAAFYVRTFYAFQIAGPIIYPNQLGPRVLLEMPTSGGKLESVVDRYTFFRSTRSEQRRLFGGPVARPRPLTVVRKAGSAKQVA